MENPDGVGEVGNILCGDTVKMSVKLSSDASKVQEAKYQTYGCVYSVACAEQVARMVNGASIEAAEKLEPDQVTTALDGVPEEKAHCAVMAVNAWRAALKNAEMQCGRESFLKSISDKDLHTVNTQKPIFSSKANVQLKHRLAEMFDDWFIPEMARRGISIHLEDIDTTSNIISIGTDKSPSIVTNFIQSSLQKYFQEKFSIRFTS